MKRYILFLASCISAATMLGMNDEEHNLSACTSMEHLPSSSSKDLAELHLNFASLLRTSQTPTNTPCDSQSPSRTSSRPSSRPQSPVFRSSSPSSTRKTPIRPALDTKHQETLRKFTEHVANFSYEHAMWYLHEELIDSDNPDLLYLLGQSMGLKKRKDVHRILSLITNSTSRTFPVKRLEGEGIDTWHLIHVAASVGKPSLVTLLNREFHHPLDVTTEDGLTPLHIAAYCGDIPTAATIIGLGVKPDKEAANIATRAQRFEFVSFLEEKHNIRPSDYISPVTSPEKSPSPAQNSDNEEVAE